MNWVSRDANVEADSLTNEEFSSFDADLRMEAKLEDLDLSMMFKLLELLPLFEETRASLKVKKTQSLPVSKRFKKKEQKSKWG